MSRDDDVDLAEVPEADAAEQQAPLDPDDLPDAGDKEAGAALDRTSEAGAVLDHASEADVLEQRQAVGGDEDYPHGGADET